MTALHAAQNIAFTLALLSVHLYGVRQSYGAVCGCLCAAVFIAYGLAANVTAAWMCNLIFLGLHVNNLKKAFHG